MKTPMFIRVCKHMYTSIPKVHEIVNSTFWITSTFCLNFYTWEWFFHFHYFQWRIFWLPVFSTGSALVSLVIGILAFGGFLEVSDYLREKYQQTKSKIEDSDRRLVYNEEVRKFEQARLNQIYLEANRPASPADIDKDPSLGGPGIAGIDVY